MFRVLLVVAAMASPALASEDPAYAALRQRSLESLRTIFVPISLKGVILGEVMPTEEMCQQEITRVQAEYASPTYGSSAKSHAATLKCVRYRLDEDKKASSRLDRRHR